MKSVCPLIWAFASAIKPKSMRGARVEAKRLVKLRLLGFSRSRHSARLSREERYNNKFAMKMVSGYSEITGINSRLGRLERNAINSFDRLI